MVQSISKNVDIVAKKWKYGQENVITSLFASSVPYLEQTFDMK